MKKTILFAVLGVILIGGCSKGVKTVKHDNGLTSVLIHDNNSLAASVNVYVRTGSIDEKSTQAGLSHFLEHLMFKGSKNYTGDELSRRVENMGGYINAATSKEYTVYYINIQKDGVEETIKMLADVMEHPLFPQEEIDKERKVVIEEIQRYSDNPVSVLYENFFKNIYTESAFKNSVIGTADVIANVSRDEIYEYYSTNYVPEKMVVVVAGNFDKKRVSKLINETFGKIPKKEVPAEPVIIENIYKSTDIVIKKDVEVGYLVLGFLGPDMKNDDIFTADLAMAILGGPKSSRLYKTLKEDKNLVYSVGSDFMTVKGTGVGYVMAVFDPKNLEAAKLEIKEQIRIIIENGVTQEELDRAKLAAKTSWNFSHEKPSDIAYNTGYWTVMGRGNISTDYLSKIEKISTKDIVDFFIKYYNQEKITSMALLPKGK